MAGSPRRRSATSRGGAMPDWVQHIPGPRHPLPQQVQQYLDWVRIQRNRPETTVRAYRQELAKWIAFQCDVTEDSLEAGDIPVLRMEEVTRESLRRYQIDLARVLPVARTRARSLVALRQFLSYAYDEGWLDTELSRLVTVPRYTLGDPHPVATEDVPRLLDELPHDNLRDFRDRALVHFLISTGCRISEALSVDRDHLRPEGFRVLGKGGKHRTVYLTSGAQAALDDYLLRRGPDEAPALFISVAHQDMPRGRARPDNRLTPDGARRALAGLRRRLRTVYGADLALEALRTPHVARHTAATTLLEATNGDVRLVQEVLGHATLETLRIYTEITDRRKQEAYRQLEEHLDSERGQLRGASRQTLPKTRT